MSGNSTSGSYRADEVTEEPVTVEWQGGLDDPWEVTVDPYAGAVIVNGRVYDVSTLASEDVPRGMYSELRKGSSREADQ